MSAKASVLLEHHLKELRLPTFLSEYGKPAYQCAAEGVDHPRYLLRLSELELIDRHHRMLDRRIRAARFPATKGLDSFDFLAIPSVNKQLVMQLARCEYVDRRENVIAMGNSGTGKTHAALGLGLAACQRGLSVGFTTAAALVHELIEARDERRLLVLQKKLARLKLLSIDELGFVPAVQDRRRAAVRGLQPALRARIDPRHHQPALRRVDRGPRLRAAHRRSPGPPDPPRTHPRNERPELPPKPEPAGHDTALCRQPCRPLAHSPHPTPLPTAPVIDPMTRFSTRDIFTGQLCQGGTFLLRHVSCFLAALDTSGKITSERCPNRDPMAESRKG